MQRILFDASVYIESLRSQDQALIQTRAVVPGTALWLSSVVIEGLYAGSNKNSIRIVEKLERDFKTVGRILTPEAGDWAGAGRILAKIGVWLEGLAYGEIYVLEARVAEDVPAHRAKGSGLGRNHDRLAGHIATTLS